jgi:hypothetical protein
MNNASELAIPEEPVVENFSSSEKPLTEKHGEDRPASQNPGQKPWCGGVPWSWQRRGDWMQRFYLMIR